ncbi:MAG: 4-phosphopantoate--beta-alanine ligase, partial [Armatimonadetes bacterium]|nr:4-phosphopantoate--beta-alanine ligase [Candidatus Hippobium faecium]
MLVKNNIEEIQAYMSEIKKQGKTIGIVPTMGALHNGHISLIKKAKEKCGFIFVSVFVNPIQFGAGEDFDKYPRTLQADLDKCQEAGVDLVFTPANDIMYTEGFSTYIEAKNISQVLEGEIRPIHFRG